MAEIISGKFIAEAIDEKTAKAVSKLTESGVKPHLCVFLVGDDKPSRIYIKKKEQAAKRLGIAFTLKEFPAGTPRNELSDALKNVQSDPTITGLIVQLPIPESLYPSLINEIEPSLDVDCLTETNLGKLIMNTGTIAPPTPGAVLAILEHLRVDLLGKTITIVGTGVLVGKPLAIMLMNVGATVTTCNEFTENIKERCLSADILISAVGKKDLIRGDMVKSGAIVIDAGVDFENNQMFGDINVDEVASIASYYTPTPGGVGPITVAQLLSNVATLSSNNSL